MSQRTKLKYKNIAAAMAIMLLIILAIPSACSNRSKKADSAESSQADVSSQTDKLDLTKNYKYVSVRNDEALSKGVLTLVDSKHPFKGGEPEDMDGVYGYLFDDKDTQIMQASSTSVSGSKHLLTAFNSMISAFHKKTQIDNIVINTIYSAGEPNADKETVTVDSPEHATGYAIDLSTYNDEDGTYPAFDADANYKWIGENCWKYGFVLRYPEDKKDITGVEGITSHYRYVGQLNAEIMNKNNFCLEEYIEHIKKYSFEAPLEYTAENGNEYVMYYVDAGNDKKVNIPVPLDENNEEYKYGYSGDNAGGYIVWVKMYEAEVVSKAYVASDDSGSESVSESGVESAEGAESETADASAQADDTNKQQDTVSESEGEGAGSGAVSEVVSQAAEAASEAVQSKAEFVTWA